MNAKSALRSTVTATIRCVVATIASVVVIAMGPPLSVSAQTASQAEVTQSQPPATLQGLVGPLYPTISLPEPGGRVLGFRTDVQIGEENATGYLPVKITFAAQGKLAADRRLVFRFETAPGVQSPPRNGLVIDVPITVPQGTGTTTFIRYLPKWSAGQATNLFILEDGRVLEDYTAAIGSMRRRRARSVIGSMEIEQQVNWIYIANDDRVTSETISNIRTAFIFGNPQPGFTVPLYQVLDQRTGIPRSFLAIGSSFLLLGQQDLPHDWRGYQRHDVAVLSAAGLQRLRSNESAMNALRGWVLSGGLVVVHEAPSLQSAFDTLDVRRIGDDESPKRIASAVIESLARHVGLDSRQQVESYLEFAELAAEKIALENVGAGQVLVIQQDKDVPLAVVLQAVANSIGYRASPMVRRGVDPMIGNRRFFEWMIPGVAQPPVYTFMGLLTAFVVLVGPVAYRRTTKVGRGYLMFAIAPALALGTTLAMFAYGIISDGFGTVVRVRQLTWVDGKSGDAGERVRSTYFAGVRPGDGLRFAADAEVIGYPEGTGKSLEDVHELSPATLGRVTVSSDQQRFDASFLPSRQQKQFVTHAPRFDVGALTLVPDPQSISAPNVESSFAFTLHEAVVRDSQGKYWSVQNLADGQTQRSKPLTPTQASKALGRLYNDHRPLSEVREQSQKSKNDGKTYDVIATLNRAVDLTTSVNDGIFERWLQSQMQTSGEIPPDHFVAIADVTPDVLAVEGSELSASIRYVFGTLR